jgi:hypothetical protein
MKNKIFTMFGLSILMLLMVTGFASAASLDTITTFTIPESIAQDSESFVITFDLTNTGGAANLDFSATTITTGATITFDDSFIADGSSTPVTETITATITFPIHLTGSIAGTIDVAPIEAGGAETLAFSVPIIPASIPEDVTECSITAESAGDDNSDLKLDIKDIKVKSGGFGKDNEWFAFDEIEVEIEVENDNNDEKMKDIVIGWGLYNTETGKWYIDDEESKFKLSENDKKTLTVTFELDDDIDDLAEYSEDYVLYVWVNAILDAEVEKDLCARASEEVSIVSESDFIILDKLQNVQTTSCGTSVQITANVWNIGDSDQQEVFVVIYNEVLGINEKVTIGDLDAFDDYKLDVLVNIPVDAEEDLYYLTISVFDEYGEVFENDFDDDKAEFLVDLTVEGNCINEPKATVSANLESEAKAGQDLVVKATVTNTGLETSTFEISLSDYSDWASFGSIDFESITLAAGESAEVLVTLNVNSDVSGNQNFNLVLTEDTKVSTQPVSVLIEAKGGFGFTGNVISEGNWPIWAIGAINVVLIFVIIFVALRVAKK